jgi:hypothetical protein
MAKFTASVHAAVIAERTTASWTDPWEAYHLVARRCNRRLLRGAA